MFKFDDIISQEDQYECAKARADICIMVHFARIELDNFLTQYEEIRDGSAI